MSPTHEDAPLSGVAALADRPVDGRRVALVFAALASFAAAACGLGVEYLLSSANGEPPAARVLRRNAVDVPPASAPTARLALLLVDGMRTDEAEALAHWSEPNTSRGTLRLPLPTLSRPFQHLLFTGVPHSVSGVRTNRFTGRARFDSVFDRVRATDGRVLIASDGLDWIPRMHGVPEDGGSTDSDALDDLPHRWLPELARGPAPGLLVLHAIQTDGTAHHGDAAGHARALAQADRLLGELLDTDLVVVCLSDHGHVAGGGHGGPESTVARAPLLIRDPQRRLPPDLGVVSASRMAATLTDLLGVARPAHALGPSLLSPVDAGLQTNVDAAQRGTETSIRRLFRRRRLAGLGWFVLFFCALGPIKRAYGFDRATPLALLAFPVFLLALHLALGRPLSLSGIDSRSAHVVRVLALGVTSASLAWLLAVGAGTGPLRRRVWRSASSVVWSASAAAALTAVSCGFALGPWPLSALTMYLPLLVPGAAVAALTTMSLVLVVSAWRHAA